MQRAGTFRLTEVEAAGGDGAGTGRSVRRPQTEDAPDAQRTMDIMMLLEIDKVPVLRDEFESKGEEGLTQAEFVHVMMKHLKRSELDETTLVSNLCELFAQIDVNGDGTMEWDEFTSFIVDTGNLARENEPNSIQRYVLTNWQDDAKHMGVIEHAYFFAGLNRVATCEANSSCLQLYDPDTLVLDRTIRQSGGQVLAAAHLPRRGEIALSSSDLTVSLYDEQNNRLSSRFRTETSQSCLEWAPSANRLYSAGVNGVVHSWDVEAGKETHAMGGVLQGSALYLVNDSHTDMVLDLLHIESLETLASASMDRTIKLWDVHTGKHKKTLEGHAKGVRSLAYSADYRFMVSAGFDFDAYVWNPYVEHLILRLHGHNAPLCKVEMVPESPQILTADTSGVVKVWDIRNFSCMQTLTCEAQELRDFCCVPSNKTLVAVGRRMYQFDYEKLRNPELTDDLPVFNAIFNSTTMTILTVSGRDVKLWDARKGTLINRFRGVCGGSELSAICLDDRERKFVVGNHRGEILVCDYMNGTVMKEFAYPRRAHLSEVSNLIYCNQHKIVISAGWDDSIMLHDEMDPEEGILLRKMEGGHRGADVTALAYSHKLSLIASGSASPEAPIVLWSFEFGRVEAVLQTNMAAATQDSRPGRPRNQASKTVTALAFLDEDLPGLISADDGGGVVFWAVRPAREWRNRALVRFVNRNEAHNSAVSALCVDQAARKLYTADEKGFVKVWDYASLLEKVEVLADFATVECENPRRKIRIDMAKSDRYALPPPASSASSNSTVFRATTVPLERSWAAHLDAIQSMQLVKEGSLSCIITAAHDCLVRLFSLQGEPLGTLRQGDSLAGLNWNFRIDIESRKRAQTEHAETILKEIEDCASYAADDEGVARNALEAGLDLDLLVRSEDSPTLRLSVSSPQASQAYVRKTPRLAPVDARMAGRGLSNSLHGKKLRARQWRK